VEATREIGPIKRTFVQRIASGAAVRILAAKKQLDNSAPPAWRCLTWCSSLVLEIKDDGTYCRTRCPTVPGDPGKPGAEHQSLSS